MATIPGCALRPLITLLLAVAACASPTAELQRAAARGDAKAQTALANAYVKGEDVSPDMSRAVVLWRRAADQGHLEAQHNLGVAFSEGLGVEENQSEATAWYRRAAEAGFVPSQINLGLQYMTGLGGERDEAQAAFWWQAAARRGSKTAAMNLAILTEGIWEDPLPTINTPNWPAPFLPKPWPEL
jgi:TPR repeat protein